VSVSSDPVIPVPNALGRAEPLQQYGRLRTADVTLAQQVVAEVYEPHTLDPLHHTGLDARLNAVQSGSLTLGYLTYGTEARIALPASERWYHVNITLAGNSRVSREDGHHGTTAGLSSAAILLPHRSQQIDWDANAAQFALKVPRADLEGHLAALSGRQVTDPVDFDLVVNLTTPAGQGLLRCVDFVRAEWDDNGVLTQHAESRRHLESMVLTNLLAAATGPHRSLLEHTADPPRPAALQRALEYVHDHVKELPTLTELTAAAGVSARTLQYLFVRETGCTPLQYLRGVRLRGAREALVHPRSADVMVCDVAAEWGFFNFGRFAALYRSAYGETPSATLGRALGGRPALPSA
jgi:AraC-like DNA-binding protein